MQKLLLLHGAIGSAAQLKPLAEQLQEWFEVFTLDFSGHGGREMPDSFSIEQFAQEVLHWMHANSIKKIAIFGYSMGGYVALYLARHFPESVSAVFTLATKFNWTPDIALQEIKMLNAEKIEEKLPAFAKQLEQRHGASEWKVVLEKTRDMMISLGNDNPLVDDDFIKIDCPVMISIGDRDTMVTFEETIVVYRQLPKASLSVYPNTPHPIEKVDVTRLSAEITSFLNQAAPV